MSSTVSEDVAEPPPRREAQWRRALVGVLGAVVYALGALPARVCYLLTDLLAVPWFLYWCLADRRGRSSRGYWRNTAIVFRPGAPLGDRRPKHHLWRWSRHIAHLLADFCLVRRLRADTVDRYCDFGEYDRLAALFAEGKGLIFATGHIGVWDVAGVAAGTRGLPLTSVFRPSPSPALDALIARMRTHTGQRVVARKNVIRTLQRVLGDGGAIGLLCDGGGKHSSVVVPFLGTPARTVATPALLQLRTGAPIAVVTVQRTGCMRYRLRVHDTIRAEPGGDREQDLLRITARVNRALGAAIAEVPEQWFWQSRKFRHRPPGEIAGPDGLPPLCP